LPYFASGVAKRFKTPLGMLCYAPLFAVSESLERDATLLIWFCHSGKCVVLNRKKIFEMFAILFAILFSEIVNEWKDAVNRFQMFVTFFSI